MRNPSSLPGDSDASHTPHTNTSSASSEGALPPNGGRNKGGAAPKPDSRRPEVSAGPTPPEPSGAPTPPLGPDDLEALQRGRMAIIGADEFFAKLTQLAASHGTAPAGQQPLAFDTLADLDIRVMSTLEILLLEKGFSAKTVTGYRSDYRIFRSFLITEGWASRFVAGVPETQVACVRAFIQWLREHGKRHNTVATYFRGLRALFRFHGDAHGTYNPFGAVPQPKGGETLVQALSDEDFRYILHVAANRQVRNKFERLRDLALLALLGLAGLRRGEAIRLTVSQVDLETGDVFVARGKGQNGGRDRVAHLLPEGLAIVRAYAAERKRRRRTHPEFLSSVTRNSRIGDATIVRLFKRLTDAAKLHATPHQLRHTFATLLDKLGVSASVRMRALGHRSLKVLEQYTHGIGGDTARELDRITLGLDVGLHGQDRGSAEAQARRSAPPLLIEDAEVAGRRDEARVPRERLDDVDRDTALQEHRDERVPEAVDRERDAGGAAHLPSEADEGRLGEVRAPAQPREEARRDDPEPGPLPEEGVEEGTKLRPDVRDAILPAPAPLPAPNAERFLGEIYIREGEPQEFTLPKPRVDECPQDGDCTGPMER